MQRVRLITGAIFLALCIQFLFLVNCVYAFTDPLDQPSDLKTCNQKTLMYGVAAIDNQIIAVGRHGCIILSIDNGKNWSASNVPVSVDLVAVHFPDSKNGWAVGHDGVILNTSDSGKNWTKQADGRTLAKIILQNNRPNKESNENSYLSLEYGERLVKEGPDKPLLSVWFRNSKEGYVAGAFNFLFKTIDGGKNWLPIQSELDNPSGLHLYSLQGNERGLYLVGEQGMIAYKDYSTNKFIQINSPYKGSYFGLSIKGPHLLICGMRGNVFFSNDSGVNWKKANLHVVSGITSCNQADTSLVLVSQTGDVLTSEKAAFKFRSVKGIPPIPYFGATQFNQSIVLVGPAGVMVKKFE
jgi:photosystem II stability/assembly factor-like uncharacterized protein